MKSKRNLFAFPLAAVIAGCGSAGGRGADLTEQQSAAASTLSSDQTPDSLGSALTVSPSPIDLTSSNPFFADFGTNGRVCGTCHQEAFGWTITPAFAATLPATAPLFVFDGSDCLPPGVANPDPPANSTQMLSKGLIRIDIGIPPTADYTLVSYTDPIGCPTPPSTSDLRMYRRPLPAANTAFLATVMWDGRENVNPPNNTPALMQADLEHQSNDATLGHAQATSGLPAATQGAIMGFETNLFNAQHKIGKEVLESHASNAGAAYLYTNTLPAFFLGINDVLDCAVPNSCAPGASVTFSSVVFTVFSAWETSPADATEASIGRGEALFNTRTFPIDDVRGLNGPNDALGVPSPLTGTCGTCHDSPNVGNHSVSLQIDIGVTTPSPVGGLDVARLPTYTFEQTSTGNQITVTDPGRGLITGKFNDLGKTKGPTLRALATRAPYFHNGSASSLDAIVDFYDARFNIGFTAQEHADLVAFLQAL